MSTESTDYPSPATMSTQTSYLMNSCSFSSVCDAYDGGIVHSLNNPLASLTASNTSFIGCCRTRNVVCEGNADRKLTPGRQNETFNGANSFTWCEWNGSRTTGTNNDYTDVASNGGAICMYGQSNATVSIKHCSFNNCNAFFDGGGIMCANIKSVEIESNYFNSCSAQVNVGGGICVYIISTCVRISKCDFQNCKAKERGGGLFLENFQVSEGCIGEENGEGESACVFDCSFTSCSLTNSWGGGMYCYNIPTAFKMRSIQFISCSATSAGGGLYFYPNQATAPDDKIYCYFLFFHECKCRTTSTPYGHDVEYVDSFNVYLNSGNPFYECYTTNTNEQRMCYAYNYSNAGAWSHQHTEKWNWLKRGILNRFVAVSGGGEEELCGLDESSACRTIGVAVDKSKIQVSLSVTLMGGNHISETATIEIGTKKIIVVGAGIEKSSNGTEANSYSSSSSPLSPYSPSSPSFTPLNLSISFFHSICSS
ncbi:uncharacterized protein MONOS_12879c2 [Monocercomonoides exilis]|uniref:uncharacterized protein n=1 Tax=Monocercomonoides exilis TaxID=2049356 RepID=UPI003559BDD7|nr:hypothetical protein MONOS_12879c1 [Monocercomonoides exilis]KAH7814959.1 hypothetical protein MONOS_12879c2 [Monocercomonoides exilis]|eukprot:MONOS_12879.1-p1 / transcript=MONOS_12879.1 / gene=MONOS_12879 / organism=Monocercomonoides_exilis_PA203 / gene_product=unspecified product / transcript_product=unspecified product / location=Mono_scaffold00745:24059-25501(-) / protein_length=481 / sequence_SO=supercontig / SO=protein_coding / is_pseudo=false